MANDHSQIVPSMQPTSTVADFKFWCQKVLPLVYDDSLSYYEVLNKMVVYLNQVIDNINADTANVAELEDDFLLLQTYVNNFFDDIDQLVTYTERAEAAQSAAATSAINAATSASNAATSASNSAGSASSAATSALSAMDAKDAAVAAKTAAEAALTSAQTAATNAAASATAAGNSATAASGSATNAAASAASALQNFQLSDAARQAAEQAADDAEASAASAAGGDGAKAQAMIAESVESTTTAEYAHNKGTYFRLNGVLYKATANIEIGDTISTSNNCEEAHVDDALILLNSNYTFNLFANNNANQYTKTFSKFIKAIYCADRTYQGNLRLAAVRRNDDSNWTIRFYADIDGTLKLIYDYLVTTNPEVDGYQFIIINPVYDYNTLIPIIVIVDWSVLPSNYSGTGQISSATILSDDAYNCNITESLINQLLAIRNSIAPSLYNYKTIKTMTANDFVFVGDILYRITGRIAATGTIIPNTNATATTIGEVLKGLLDA